MSIISRSRWGARYGTGFGSRSVGRLNKYLHHTVTASPGANATLAQDVAAVRSVERIGQARFKGGISYSFVIPKSGRIFEGCPVGRIGSHTGGHNTTSVGIALIGNYENDAPTKKQIAALVWLLIEGVKRGWWRQPILTGGHRDTKATACPGRKAYAEIPAINRAGRAGDVPAAKQPKPKGPNLLKVDGVWGGQTTRAEQRRLGMRIVDGEISRQNEYWREKNPGLGAGWQWVSRARAMARRGSPTILADQRQLRAKGLYKGKRDGIAGPQYFTAKQKALTDEGWNKGKADGVVSRPSKMVKAMQRKENDRRQKAWDRKNRK